MRGQASVPSAEPQPTVPHYTTVQLPGRLVGNEAIIDVPSDFVVTNLAVYETADHTQTVVITVGNRPVPTPIQLLNIPVSAPVANTSTAQPTILTGSAAYQQEVANDSVQAPAS